MHIILCREICVQGRAAEDIVEVISTCRGGGGSNGLKRVVSVIQESQHVAANCSAGPA
jgi:hypothetical protein